MESQVAEEKRKKLSYYDPTIHVLESASRWDEIIQNELFDKEDLKLSLFRGVCACDVVSCVPKLHIFKP